jgi:hypothetical protein
MAATNAPIQVKLPDGSRIFSTHTCKINLPGLPDAAKIAHIFPGLANHALISIGQLCDNHCTATFTNTKVVISRDNIPLFSGPRDTNGLWHLPLPLSAPLPPPTTVSSPSPHQANIAISSSTLGNLLKFLHASLFSPVPSSLIKSINNNHFTMWPGLTAANVNRHLPKSMATTLGHLDQARQNHRSTKLTTLTTSNPPDSAAEDDPFPPLPPITDGNPTHFVYAAIESLPERTGKIATDQTGAFPVLSNNGMRYVMVLYDYDSNAILAEALKNRKGPEIHRTYKKLHTIRVSHGLRPKLQRLDNEASNLLKKCM